MTIFKQVLVLIMLVMLSWADVSAQLLKDDVVYHKNGSVIRGKITEQNADTLKIVTNCSNFFVFPKNDILKIENEPQKKAQKRSNNSFTGENTKGFYNYTTIGMLTGNSEVTDDFTFSFHTSFGYEFSHLLGVGAGIGVEHLKTELLPVYVSIKSHLFNKPNSPFANFTIGYSFPLSDTKKKDEYINFSYKGGLCLGLDLGISSFKTKNYAFTITAGYKYQVVEETSDLYYYYWYGDAKEVNTYQFNKIAVRIGFMFR